MLPPILKAYPSQGSLQNMVSSSSGDQTGPLASASLQDGAPRQTMAGQSSESAGLQRGSDGLDTPRAQVTTCPASCLQHDLQGRLRKTWCLLAPTGLMPNTPWQSAATSGS